MSNTSNLQLPYLAVGQAQKHVTVNETLRRLDAIVQLSVVSATTSVEPGSPGDGEVYIVPPGKSGANWSAYANWALGYYRDGAWVAITPCEGWIAVTRDTDELLRYSGSAWEKFAASKIIAVSASDKLVGRASSGAGAAEEIACTAAGRALIDDADAAAQRSTLGLGTAALKNTGTSGANVPLLNGANSWSAQQAFSIGPVLGANAGDTALTINSGSGAGGRLVYQNAGTNKLEVGRGAGDGSDNFNVYSYGAGGIVLSVDYTTGALTSAGAVVGSPSGGYKGAGSINAEAVYDDNTLLSCYVFDMALDGAIDLAKWDAKVPGRGAAGGERRVHVAARKFAGRAGTAHDPLTLDGYAAHWREKRHLTSMPNEATFDPRDPLAAGAWIQRLVETVEIQAVLIEQLNGRLSAVEATTRRA